MSSNVETNLSPTTSNVSVKILKESSTTPMPDFNIMEDNDIKKELERHGMRPLCRKKAIRLLQRIFEATHPVLSNSTPIARRVTKTLIRTQKRKIVSKAMRDRRTRVVISKISKQSNANLNQLDFNLPAQNFDETKNLNLNENDSSSICFMNSNDLNFEVEEIPKNSKKINEIDTSNKNDSKTLIREFLEWLRLFENEELYYQLLTLNSVFFENLIQKFNNKLRKQKFSKAKFSEMLDLIHITYCIPKHDK